jgi:hypothetical protein
MIAYSFHSDTDTQYFREALGMEGIAHEQIGLDVMVDEAVDALAHDHGGFRRTPNDADATRSPKDARTRHPGLHDAVDAGSLQEGGLRGAGRPEAQPECRLRSAPVADKWARYRLSGSGGGTGLGAFDQRFGATDTALEGLYVCAAFALLLVDEGRIADKDNQAVLCGMLLLDDAKDETPDVNGERPVWAIKSRQLEDAAGKLILRANLLGFYATPA